MARKIRFGGPNLPVGTSTWYLTLAEGRIKQVRADVGHEVDAARVMRERVKHGKAETYQDADYYVRAGYAEYVNDPGGRALTGDKEK